MANSCGLTRVQMDKEFLNNKGQDGRAAIHNVVDCTVESKQQGYEQCFWILLEEGADVNSVDNALRSPLHIGIAGFCQLLKANFSIRQLLAAVILSLYRAS